MRSTLLVMSVEALSWAFKQEVESSSIKFVLVTISNFASDETGLAFPSIETLTKRTGHNRKTVIAAIDWLEKSGFLSDTGERRGHTKSVKVYRVHHEKVSSPKNGTSSKNGAVPFLPGSSPENGIGKQSLKRDTESSVLESSEEPSVLSDSNSDCQRGKKSKKSHPLHTEFIKQYSYNFQNRFNQRFIWEGQAHVVGELLHAANGDLVALGKLIEDCWNHPNPYYRARGSNLRLLLKEYSSLVTIFSAQPPSPAPARQTQPAYQRDWTDEEFHNPPGPSPDRVRVRAPGEDPYAQ